METYRKWVPVEGLPTELYCEGLHDDYEQMRILLRAQDSTAETLRILFRSVIAYRNVNESYRLRTWNNLGTAPPPLSIVEESAWIAWLKIESGGILDGVSLTHYAIITPDDCIDVVSDTLPVVEWLE